MRIAITVFGGLAILAVLTPPVPAKNSHAQKIDEQPASSLCQAYRQTPDGSWTALPCKELGTGGQAQPRSAARKTDESTH